MGGPFDSIARSIGNALSDMFGQDFQEYFHLDAAHPETNENLFVGLHADGKGATVLTESDIPDDVTVEAEWTSYVEQASASLNGNAQLQDAIGEIFSMYGQLGEGTPELKSAMSGLDLMNPDYIDVFHIDHSLEEIARIAGDRHTITGNELEASERYDLKIRAEEMRENFGATMDSPEASALIAVDRGLHEIGLDSHAVHNLMVIPENVNAIDPSFKPDAPAVDIPQIP